MITYLHPLPSKEYVWLLLHTFIHLHAVVLGYRIIAVPLYWLMDGWVSHDYGKFIF